MSEVNYPTSGDTLVDEKEEDEEEEEEVVTPGEASNQVVCFGDSIALYCQDTAGYVYSENTSSAHKEVSIFTKQDQQKPEELPNSDVATFVICIQKRYKLHKKYRKLKAAREKDRHDLELEASLALAKSACEAEYEDNAAEQRRQNGKLLRYGQIIQLKHVFSGKYLHTSSTQTSQRDKNNLLVFLEEHSARHAYFQILPRYKVKTEGDIVYAKDEIILESYKSDGQFLHASTPWSIADQLPKSELNLGIKPSGFTVIRVYKPNPEEAMLVRGGSCVRLFHTELEAYLSAEGLFDEKMIENVHLRLRPVDQSQPRSLIPSTSGITYWQLELEESHMKGDVLKWKQQVRLCHMTTRRYLYLDDNNAPGLASNSKNPRTVFRFHPVIKEGETVPYESFARIEHVISGRWLHALKEEEYVKSYGGDGLRGPKWDGAEKRKIGSAEASVYVDAFALQEVKQEDLSNFSFVAGCVPPILELIRQRNAGGCIDLRHGQRCNTTLHELQEFLYQDGEPSKKRQKLLRNLRVVDIIVDLLKIPVNSNAVDARILEDVSLTSLDLLFDYLQGNSRKNELYFGNHLAFFENEFNHAGEFGLRAVNIITELVRDNRTIVDQIGKSDIEVFVKLLKKTMNFRYLDLLDVLCVCDGITIPDNQIYITKQWLEVDRGGVYLTEFGENVGKRQGRLHVSQDGGKTWEELHEFVGDTTKKAYYFLTRQLNLFGKLCKGRNSYSIKVITEKLGYLTWDEAFTCLTDESLPDILRADYCCIINDLFINVGKNHSVEEDIELTYDYTKLGTGKTVKNRKGATEELKTIFPQVREWLAKFLDRNKAMTGSLVGRNVLIEQVLGMLALLIKFGYYGRKRDVIQVTGPLLDLLDGRNDSPYPAGKGATAGRELLKQYRAEDRFKPGEETKAIVDAKYTAMEVLDILLTFQMNGRLEAFVGLFKSTKEKADGTSRKQGTLVTLLESSYVPFSDHMSTKLVTRSIDSLWKDTAFFDRQQVTAILLDLSHYQYDKMVTRSLSLLNRIYSSREVLFTKAVQAQVLLTEASRLIFEAVDDDLPHLRHLAKAKLTEEQSKEMIVTCDRLAKFCHLPDEPEEPHGMNQSILVNQGIMDILLSVLTSAKDDSHEMKMVFVSALNLLRNLTRGNKTVQDILFKRLAQLLKVKGAETELGNTIVEVFVGNQMTCMKVTADVIQQLVKLAATHQERAPEFLDVLSAIVKVEELNLPLKRNQVLVMKHFMENYHSAGYILEKTERERLSILQGHQGQDHQSYLISLVDLLATCAEGENLFIESICQTILPVSELLSVLTNPQVDTNFKRPYLRYLLWVYMNTAGSRMDAGTTHLHQNRQMWDMLRAMVKEIDRVKGYAQDNADQTSHLLKKPPAKSCTGKGSEGEAHSSIHMIFDSAMPFLEVFFSQFYIVGETSHPQDAALVDLLAESLLGFADAIGDLIANVSYKQVMVDAVTTLISVSNLPIHMKEGFVQKYALGDEIHHVSNPAREEYHRYFFLEELYNTSLNTFAENVSKTIYGVNTVRGQLGAGPDREYNPVNAEADLPLGQEFQDFVSLFVEERETDPKKKYALARKIADQLGISSKRSHEHDREKQDQLDIKCLQLLRAMIHNEERKLPQGWQKICDNDREIEPLNTQLRKMCEIQEALGDHNAVEDVLPLVASKNTDVVRESLAFCVALMMNGNKKIQASFTQYFYNTREEKFFFSLLEEMQVSEIAIKERRSLLDQYKARTIAAAKKAQTLKTTLSGARLIQDKKPAKSMFEESKLSNGKVVSFQNGGLKNNNKKSKLAGMEHMAFDTDSARIKELEAAHEHTVELVLMVMSGLCDGQNTVLQDYLRDQPDNIKSIDLVIQTTHLLDLFYHEINPVNIHLVIQIFSTLNEFVSGNHANQITIFENKIIDYVNFIMRTEPVNGCDPKQILELKNNIAHLLFSMVEEVDPDTRESTREIVDTLDGEAIWNTMVDLYLDSKSTGGGKRTPVQEVALNVGFEFHFILARMVDIHPDLTFKERLRQKDLEAKKFFSSRTRTIEVLKHDQLQKIYFRRVDTEILREDVKEKCKWEIDRSSPTNKIRDLMKWAEDIKHDMRHQVMMRSNPIIRPILQLNRLWSYLVILLSLSINVFMLFTWNAEGAHGVTYVNDTNALPKSFREFKPKLTNVYYPIVIYTLGGLHILFSLLVVLEFFLSNRPALPTVTWFKNLLGISTKNKDGEKEHDQGSDSYLRTDLISLATLYYVTFITFSILGEVYYGYFFAFHLFHVIQVEPLLQRVIKAITTNGTSLLWVGFLFLIIFYIYALIAFAFLRSAFDPAGEQLLYCDTLWHCLVTVMRFGLIGEIYELMRPHGSEATFGIFGQYVAYHITFYILISAIGLNLVFGIIVDTFSELRDTKWQAEQDMRDNCFICSRASYDFEHTGEGFDHHVKHEHSMWSYILFTLHLEHGNKLNFTALELYISKKIAERDYSYFPVNRALTLAKVDDDSADYKIDEILEKLNKILNKQNAEELEKVRATERLKRQRWERRHRAPGAGGPQDGGQGPPPPPRGRSAPSSRPSSNISLSGPASRQSSFRNDQSSGAAIMRIF